MTTIAPGHTYFSGTYDVPEQRDTSHRHLVVVWVLAIALIAAGLVAVSGALDTPTARYVCPPDCGTPPFGEPVTINPRFTAADGSFTVAYPAEGAAYNVTKDSDGINADLLAGDGGTLQLFSRPALGRPPRDIAYDLIRESIPDTKTAYEIPNAMVGYQPGFGVAADHWPQGATASYSRMRVLVMVAVKNDLALIAAAHGPYHAFGPEFGSGKPSAANLQIALDMGKFVNSFTWRGDPAR
ncbi:hypothetical protein [Mycolicibacterium sediminis]|uniref:Uncharacterized protein n=1 Tax=Mycolicibacterium sediminis TaxID=1286180 RepID=A0A7I7QQW9_9MYCO|nr:hypothetical protein [Mycolicibacterium sediminis]BBY28420.1 hypothetical protein MSEDJ_25160 [Mycolicibacterium sediminis]